jgi:hypothetical protein
MYAMAGVVDVQPEPHPSFAVELLNSWRTQPENRIAISTIAALSLVTTIALTMGGDVQPIAQLWFALWLIGPVLPLVWLGRVRDRREEAFRKAVEEATFRVDLAEMPTLDERLASHRAELALLAEMRTALDAGNESRYRQLAQQMSTGPQAIVLRAELDAVLQDDRTAGRVWDLGLAVGFLVAGWLLGLFTDVIRGHLR